MSSDEMQEQLATEVSYSLLFCGVFHDKVGLEAQSEETPNLCF